MLNEHGKPNIPSIDDVTKAGSEIDSRDADIVKDLFNRASQAIDSGLRGMTPPVGTSRALSDSQRELSKLGLDISKLVLDRLKSLCVSHGDVLGCEQPNDRHNRAGENDVE